VKNFRCELCACAFFFEFRRLFETSIYDSYQQIQVQLNQSIFQAFLTVSSTTCSSAALLIGETGILLISSTILGTAIANNPMFTYRGMVWSMPLAELKPYDIA